MSLTSYYAQMFQFGYVSRDLERAIDILRKKLDLGPFTVVEPELTGMFGTEEKTLKFRVGLANIGDRQVEVIQALSGAIDYYLDGIDYESSPITLHHIGLLVPGPESAWDEMQKAVKASGDEFTVIGWSNPRTDPYIRFAYVDTRPHYGHYTEYLWRSPGAQAAHESMSNYGPR
jgi:hypothetical protein